MAVSMLWLSLALILTLFCLAFETVKTSAIAEAESVEFCGVTSSAPLTPELSLGKALFKNNCASCHNKNMKDDLTGPALKGVTERWANYPEEDLYSWIRNSELLTEKGHPRAKALVAEWNAVMTSFPSLTDEEIEALLDYIEM